MPVDFIDLPALQKRGIAIRKEVSKETQNENSFVDLSQLNSKQPLQSSANTFDFLDSLAGSASKQEESSYFNRPNEDIQDFKVQIENFEYKLDRLTEKLALIESKLQNFENKVD